MPQNGNVILTVLPFIFMIFLFYVFVIIPEKKRKIKYNAMIGSLKLNDEILTRGGIIGKIVKLGDDSIIIETGPDRTKLKLKKNGIVSVISELAVEKA